ncbi:MAG: hypothetical protein QG670_1562 [Thermoproteota archaeon]|nr:hypothetical protein [Thermoproteota archaeon]
MTSRIGVDMEYRGRHRGSDLNFNNFLSMVLIASKHDLDPKQLIDAFYEAAENKISRCGSLTISCRKINQDSAIFLIMKEEKVVWQFPVNLKIITDPYVRESIKEIPMPEKTRKIDELGRNTKISELRSGMKGINLLAKIVDIPPTKYVFTKWDTEASVSNVKLADETGSIRLGLWNNRIGTVKIGDEVEIKNCDVSRFMDQPQLKLKRKSIMSINPIQQEELIQHSILG